MLIFKCLQLRSSTTFWHAAGPKSKLSSSNFEFFNSVLDLCCLPYKCSTSISVFIKKYPNYSNIRGISRRYFCRGTERWVLSIIIRCTKKQFQIFRSRSYSFSIQMLYPKEWRSPLVRYRGYILDLNFRYKYINSKIIWTIQWSTITLPYPEEIYNAPLVTYAGRLFTLYLPHGLLWSSLKLTIKTLGYNWVYCLQKYVGMMQMQQIGINSRTVWNCTL